MPLHHTIKKRLHPFQDIFERMRVEVYAKVGNLNEEERRQLEAAVGKLTPTNCSWTLYQMREHITDAVDYHRESERQAAELAQRASAGSGDPNQSQPCVSSSSL